MHLHLRRILQPIAKTSGLGTDTTHILTTDVGGYLQNLRKSKEQDSCYEQYNGGCDVGDLPS